MKFRFALFLSIACTVSYAQKMDLLKLKGGNGIGIFYTVDGKNLISVQENNIVIFQPGTSTVIREVSPQKKGITHYDYNAVTKVLNVTISGRYLEQYLIPDLSFQGSFDLKTVNPNRIFSTKYGQKVILETNKGELYRYNLEDNTMVLITDETYSHLNLNNEKDQFVIGKKDGSLDLIDIANLNTLLTLPSQDEVIKASSFSLDDAELVVGDTKGNLNHWNLIDGAFLGTLFSLPRWVTTVEYSHNEGVLLAVDESGNLGFYNTLDKRLFYQSEIDKLPRDISFNPDGSEIAFCAYQASGSKVFNIEFLELTPIYSFSSDDDTNGPQIFVSKPPKTDQVVRYSESIIDIKGLVMDDFGVKEIRINDRVVPIKAQGNFLMYLPLEYGENPVNIVATDINNNISQKRFIINRIDGNAPTYNPDSAVNYLFAIGIDAYEYWSPLNNAVKDIHDMTTALTSRYNFEEENLILIADSAATKNNIINELRSLIEKVGPNDNLVVIYSGHGYFDELLNEGYWIPMEAKKNSFGDYIANQTLLNILKNIQSQHIFLVADACFSGSLLASSGRGYTESVEKYKSRWCLASGRLEVVSDGQLGANSPFAKTLIDYLNNNEKEALAVSELVTDVKIKVAEQAAQTPIGSPLKNIGDEGGEFIFRLKQD